VLLSMIAIIVYLALTQIDYQDYQRISTPYFWLLELAIVALAIPLYKEFVSIKQHIGKIFLCNVVGLLTSSSIAVVIAHSLGADQVITASLAPNAVTTPIAISISNYLNGLPSLSAVIVILVGVFGAVFTLPFFSLVGITNWQAKGLAIGSACHAIGTARALEENDVMGAYASVSLTLCACMAPFVVPLNYAFLTLFMS
jgi:putative effector of murein hydrolase